MRCGFALGRKEMYLCMFKVIGIMFVGILVGFVLRKLPHIGKVNKTVSMTVFCMLFLMGASIGSNRDIISHLASFGWQALVLALWGLAGSVIVGWAVYRFVFRKGGDKL